MMSIPRDLWVEVADTGEMGRINGAYNRGPANLVQTVKNNLDVPVNHYMEVGFGSFVGLVDAIGGVTINFPNPVFDPGSGLNVTTSGDVTLDGQQALAYARARNYTEIIDGRGGQGADRRPGAPAASAELPAHRDATRSAPPATRSRSCTSRTRCPRS